MKELEAIASQEVDWSGYAFDDVLRAFLNTSFYRQLSVAAWRLPNQRAQHVILDTSGEASLTEWQLEELTPGFIASPFINPEEKSPYIRADIYYRSGKSECEAVCGSNQATEVHTFLHQQLKKQQSAQVHTVPLDASFSSLEATTFNNMVAEAVEAIERGDFKKVVPSRSKLVPLPDNFDAARTFQQLCDTYPTAFVSLFSIPGVGTWMGASPEILVSISSKKNRKTFRTVALAGTQSVQGENPLKNAAWRQKEIEEQAMVSRYIINCFKRIRLREFEEDGPKTTAAGNLLHLRTDFTVDMEATNFPELGSVMLKLLHPTSAVCGMPKASALDFIQQYEGYDRSFFSGFLGPVNMQEETHLFVNLRCMQLLDQRAALYAGAGVTIDSEPEREWKETEMKMRTIQQIMTNE
ncbi:chorismate-binding protein [Tunicatimonas pelagia]|uniref:chorismate-binding protein n=1 Tax=Tunicatimonas pelagia TaxID=931531 RepID=UPI0026660219|nr:chorismate-binding protein [Tunicatimonas pelagia]WKN45681.1 chorismate-binding protein [Tunicatimonas pelagia]